MTEIPDDYRLRPDALVAKLRRGADTEISRIGGGTVLSREECDSIAELLRDDLDTHGNAFVVGGERVDPLGVELAGGFCVPRLYDSGSLSRSFKLSPEIEEALERSRREWNAKPWYEKAARRVGLIRDDLSWRVGAAWRILVHGDDPGDDW